MGTSFKGYTRDKNEFEKPELIDKFIALCKTAGHDICITCTARDYKFQTALFAQGREKLAEVNRLRKMCGVYLITAEENKKQVTWTMSSKHIVNLEDDKLNNDKARAFDFCIKKHSDNDCDWDIKADTNGDGISDYRECALLGESLGLISGMRFKTADWPHLELPD